MKTQKPVHALLAAFVLLVGISSTDALLCADSLFAGTVATCDCPLGMGPSLSLVGALPTLTGVGYGTSSGNAAAQLAALKLALIECTDLLPGYKQSADTVLPTACIQSEGFCPGTPAAYASNAATATGADGGYTLVLTGAHSAGSATDTHTTSDIPVACPTNSVATGSAPFTLAKCIPTAGYYVASIHGTTKAPTISQCPQGSTCPTGLTAASTAAESAPVQCDLYSGGNHALTPGGFICPLGTTGVLGTSIAASLAALTGPIICGVGSGPKANRVTCDVLPGYFGATSATGAGSPLTTPAQSACPTGITGNAGASLPVACTDIAPGYDVLSDIARQDVAGVVTSLEAGITACAGVNKFCPGKATAVVFKGTTTSLVTFSSVAKLAGADKATSCPTGTGNALTGAAAQGVNAVSYETGCVDLLPTYAFKASVSATNAIGSLIELCTVDKYGCTGSAGLFADYDLADKTLVTGTGLLKASPSTVVGDIRVSSATVLTTNLVTPATGILSIATCTSGSQTDATGGTQSSCLVKPGRYMDASDLTTSGIKDCPANHYCVGGTAFGTAGGSSECPTGSSGLAAASIESSHISDCKLSAGFYIASAALNTPVPCLTDTVCAGGGPVGVAGGSVACPAGSTNTECSAASAASTTVNLTPASQPITVDVAAPTAAGSPSVTVTNTPSASSAASTVASMVVVTVAAMVAL